MSRIVMLLLVLGGCATNAATSPDLSLTDRFEMVALRNDAGDPTDELIKWSWPIRVQVIGSQHYHQDVAAHLALLGELTRLPTEMDSARPNMVVEFSERRTGFTCQARIRGRNGRLRTTIHIGSDLRPNHIRQCIIQEMTQSLGLIGDLDGMFGSRSDTAFTSYGRIIDLTEADRQLLAILYDDRLYDGMPRDEALAVVRQIVAEMEAAEGIALEAPR